MPKQNRGPYILAAGAAAQLLTGIPAAWGVFQQPVMEEYGLSEQGAGYAFGILIAAFGVGCVLGGFLQDRHGPRCAGLWGTALLCGGSAALIYSGAASRQISNMLISMACYIVMAVSLNLVVGLLGELSLGHAGFMSVGLFTGCLLSIQLAQSVPIGVRMPLSMLLGGVAAAVVGLVAALFAALAGFLIGIPVLRLKGDYLAIVTLACGEIIKTIINNLSVTGGAKGLDTSEIYADTRTLLPFAIVLIFLVVLVMMNLKNSRHGRAIMAIRDNRIAAESNGVNVTYYKLMVFVLAAFFAGMAGVLYGHTLANIKPAMFDYNMSIEILVIVVLGGMGSIRGSIIATIILRALPEVLRQVADYRMLAYSVLLIVIMLLNSSPQFAEWKGRWSLKALLSLGKARKEKTKKEAAKK